MRAMHNAAFLIEQSLITAKTGVRINLDKYVKHSHIISNSDVVKLCSIEDKCLVGKSLHPPEGSVLTTSLSQTRIHLQLVDFTT